MKKKTLEDSKYKALNDYVKNLHVILTRIEDATKEGNLKKADQWYHYLQGYIKTSNNLIL